MQFFMIEVPLYCRMKSVNQCAARPPPPQPALSVGANRLFQLERTSKGQHMSFLSSWVLRNEGAIESRDTPFTTHTPG
jgi:hypothetical protein